MTRDEVLNMPEDELFYEMYLRFGIKATTRDDVVGAYRVIETLDTFKLTKSFGLGGVVWVCKLSDDVEVFEKTLPLAVYRATLLAMEFDK